MNTCRFSAIFDKGDNFSDLLFIFVNICRCQISENSENLISLQTTAVGIAFLKGHIGMVDYLLNQPGVDIDFKNDEGK